MPNKKFKRIDNENFLRRVLCNFSYRENAKNERLPKIGKIFSENYEEKL